MTDPAPGIEDADDVLVERARAGEIRAFEALLARHETAVLRVLRLLGIPAQDREDVAQDVFMRVFRHLGGYRAGGSFAGWVYRVTVNASHTWRRGHGRRRQTEAPWPDGLDAAAESAGGPEDAATDAMLRRRLEAALESLTERERAVFVLREVEGLETLEVARALGITRVTVRRHLGLARRRLRGLLGLED